MSAQRVRELLASGRTINMPGVYDALTARLAEQAGFVVGFVSGYAVSAARLAAPDFGYLSQSEMAETAREVCAATTMPIIVDADTGYGNALSAIRTARGLHAAGAAGLFLEDQVWPESAATSPASGLSRPRSGGLQAVVDLAHEGIDLFVVARTDARAAVSLDDALARARAAVQIGVDAIFVEAPQSVAELRRSRPRRPVCCASPTWSRGAGRRC